jgi:hypothetical protein
MNQPRMTKSEVREVAEAAIQQCAEISGLTDYLIFLLCRGGMPPEGAEERLMLFFERDFDLSFALYGIIDPEFFKTKIGRDFGDLLDQSRWTEPRS